MSVQKFRKKPVVVEAFRYFDNRIGSQDPFWDWMKADCEFSDPDGVVYDLQINTLEGLMKVNNGDWIIKGVNGEFYPCKPYIFEKTYEGVTE